MKLIVGLGNPGKEYAGTRHNAGFMLLDKLACHPDLAPAGQYLDFKTQDKFKADIAEVIHKGEKIILAKPQTFMNLSGEAVSKILNYYQLDSTDLIVVLDDKDLPVGQARIRQEGGSAGQRGLQNIIDVLKTDNLLRIRIGVMNPKGDSDNIDAEKTGQPFDTVRFVLSKFEDREKKLLDAIMDETIEYIIPYLGKETPIPAHTISVTFDSL